MFSEISAYLKREIPSLITGFVTMLAISWGLSLLAPYAWLFDLFSHFLFQYLIGSVILLVLCVIMRKWRYARICLLILGGTLIQFSLYAKPQPFVDYQKPVFTVLQYNRFVLNKDYKAMEDFLREKAAIVDVVSLQEVMPDAVPTLKKLQDVYPYSYHAALPETWGDVYILSRHPIKYASPFWAGEKNLGITVLNALIQKEGFEAPFSIYAFHTIVPTTLEQQSARNKSLQTIAARIRDDDNNHVIALGDWNITPYSPHFRDFVIESGLHHSYEGLRPPVTWPASFKYPLFQIPIDHILSDQELTATSYGSLPAMGADHKPLMARFVETP